MARSIHALDFRGGLGFRPRRSACALEAAGEVDDVLVGGGAGCHGTAAHGRPRPPAARRRGTGAARGRPGRAARAGAERRGAGWSSQASNRGRPSSASPTAQARGRAADRVVDELRPARAAATCKAEGPGTDSARRARRPRPAAEVVPAGTADRRDALSGVGGHGSRLRGQPVSSPPPRSRGRARPGSSPATAAEDRRRRSGRRTRPPSSPPATGRGVAADEVALERGPAAAGLVGTTETGRGHWRRGATAGVSQGSHPSRRRIGPRSR